MSLNKQSSISTANISNGGLSTAKLKQFIQNEVYSILGGIKQQIEIKMKEIDRNLNIIRSQITDMKANSAAKNNAIGCNNDKEQIQGALKALFLRVQKIQKEVLNIKSTSTLSDHSYVNTDISKSNISSFNPNQGSQKSISNGKNNTSPLFKKIYNQTIDLNALIFQEQKDNRLKPEGFESPNTDIPITITRNQKKTSIFSNPSQNLMKKPPLPVVENKPKGNSSSQYSTSTNFYRNQHQNQNLKRNNQIISSNNPQDKVQKQLSRNKNVFLRRKNSQQKNQDNISEKSDNTRYHRFLNQLEDFSVKQDESFNIQLQYSKDTFLSDI